MSKSTQRKESVFSEGRAAYREAKKSRFYDMKGDKNWINPYSKKTGLRTVWNAGWMEESRR